MNTAKETALARLKLLIDQYATQTAFAEKIGKPSTRVSQWATGYRNMSDDTKRDIEQSLGLPVGWFDQPLQKDPPPTERKVRANASYLGTLDPWDSSTPLSDDEVEVPFYKEICLAAGNGFTDDIEDHNGYKLRFSRASLRRHGINPADVSCVTADGDSMEPVIPDGTTLGINKADKTIKDGKIYAINHGGLLRTKILKKRPGERVLIQSYNSESYPDEEVGMDEISIIGRIFWWSVLA